MDRARRCAADTGDTNESGRAVHALRVASRRAAAELRSLKEVAPEQASRRLRKSLRALRRAAGEVRNADVHTELLDALHAASTELAPTIDEILRDIKHQRRDAMARLDAMVSKAERARVQKLVRHVRADVQPAAEAAVLAATGQRLASLVEESVGAVRLATTDALHLHTLRILLKRTRYTAELLGPGDGSEQRLRWLIEAQKRLGEANDVATLVTRLRGVEQRSTNPQIAHIRQRFESLELRRLASAAAWLKETDAEHRLRALVPRGAPIESKPSTVTPVASEPAQRADREASGNEQSNLFLAGERFGVVDVGSNGIRLLAVELIDDHSWTVLAEERATARLAQGQGKSKSLCTEAMARAVEAIHRFKLRCDALKCPVRAFATAAVRDASNRSDFVSLVKDRTGLDVSLISALDEGRYTYAAVARRHDLSHGLCAVVDIGGGSLEVVLSIDGVIVQNSSMPLGAVRLTEAFDSADMLNEQSFKNLTRHIDRELSEKVPTPGSHGAPHMVVGCGGTFTTMLTLGAAMRGVIIERNSPALRTLGPVTRPQLRDVITRLRTMSLAERLRVPGLPADRADIIVAGLTVIERLMKHLGVAQIHANPGGVREGLLTRLIRERTSELDPHASRDERLVASARAFAEACRYERGHSERVASLAVRLYDRLHAMEVLPRLGSEPHERAILEAAAVLHDVGIMVEYARHHKHSATMVRHADLPGWDARMQEVLAQVCRYHRRKAPSPKHNTFASLPDRDQALVLRLSALLRVADGLDRSHAAVVHDVRARRDGRRIVIHAVADADATTEVRAAAGKADVLETVTGRNVVIRPVLGPMVPAPIGPLQGEIIVRTSPAITNGATGHGHR